MDKFRGFTGLFAIMWVVYALGSLAVTGVIAYVIIHFVSKLW